MQSAICHKRLAALRDAHVASRLGASSLLGEVWQIPHEPLGTSTASICTMLLAKHSLPHIHPRTQAGC